MFFGQRWALKVTVFGIRTFLTVCEKYASSQCLLKSHFKSIEVGKDSNALKEGGETSNFN